MVATSDIRHKVMVTIINNQCNYLIRNACMPFTWSKSIRCGDASYFSLFQLNSWKTQTTTTTTDRADRSETKTATSATARSPVKIESSSSLPASSTSMTPATSMRITPRDHRAFAVLPPVTNNISISLFDSSVIPTTYSSATNHDCQSLFIQYYYPRHHKGTCTGS